MEIFKKSTINELLSAIRNLNTIIKYLNGKFLKLNPNELKHEVREIIEEIQYRIIPNIRTAIKEIKRVEEELG